MSFYSRPSHLRVPGPGEKKAEQSPTSRCEVASENDSPSAPPEVAATISEPTTKPSSALEAWSSADGTAIVAGAPRVREQRVSKAKAKAQLAKKLATPPEAISKTPISGTQDEAQAAPQGNREAHRETRILVIENDVEAADHVINILESDGYAVEIATDATYGVMLAQTYLPHLILLGALSEHLSGADFMRSLRNVPGFAERSQVTPVLYLIDNSQLLQQRFQGLRDTPLTSTIFKPANERELLQKIERALNFEIDFPAESA